MFRACCVVIILAQSETVVQTPDEFLAVFPRMRGAFSTFYTNTTKLFPQCWRGNTKVFNIFSTIDEIPFGSTAFSALVAHPEQTALHSHILEFFRVEHQFHAVHFPAQSAVKCQRAGI